ncbi:Hypothetical Protein FCC1311_073602 [Hondaea fermentalgiana]|uniref:Uncharacterized protein n=1 Tax=Hondaea fermentalgiana TaxID=2315210 RepID=A0A2R5GLF2_9STRA|nr:Hypothetical Protein FCC1311_073602 [Hondaea fermentalgiana]|eukprot:GBG31139.1 Hypothetical Protein FCC1311_073602 [Hondaea fermentalgiana]
MTAAQNRVRTPTTLRGTAHTTASAAAPVAAAADPEADADVDARRRSGAGPESCSEQSWGPVSVSVSASVSEREHSGNSPLGENQDGHNVHRDQDDDDDDDDQEDDDMPGQLQFRRASIASDSESESDEDEDGDEEDDDSDFDKERSASPAADTERFRDRPRKRSTSSRKRSGLFRVLSTSQKKAGVHDDEDDDFLAQNPAQQLPHGLTLASPERVRPRVGSRCAASPLHLARSPTSTSAPELTRSYSRSVLDDMTCDVSGEFRNCRHCRTIFPFVQPPGADPAGREAIRLSFCSGECHLSFVTLYQIQRLRRRSARRMR